MYINIFFFYNATLIINLLTMCLLTFFTLLSDTRHLHMLHISPLILYSYFLLAFYL